MAQGRGTDKDDVRCIEGFSVGHLEYLAAARIRARLEDGDESPVRPTIRYRAEGPSYGCGVMAEVVHNSNAGRPTAHFLTASQGLEAGQTGGDLLGRDHLLQRAGAADDRIP